MDPIMRVPFHPMQIEHLGPGITLAEAQRRPGLYIKNGDRFIFVADFNTPQGARTLFEDSSELRVLLLEPGYDLPRVPNNAPFVLIGVTDINFARPHNNGWTIPFGVEFGVHPATGFPGIPQPERRVSSLMNYVWDAGGTRGRHFETVNGENPHDPSPYNHSFSFSSNVLYTRWGWPLMRFQGIISAWRGEEFTFGWFEGTNWIERTYVADRQFFAFPTNSSHSPHFNRVGRTITRTPNGYFELDINSFSLIPAGEHHLFNRVAEGVVGIGSGRYAFNNVIELYAPNEVHVARRNMASVRVNGENHVLPTYNFNGNNFFRIRDIAYILNGTSAQFDVGWEHGTITFTHGRGYTPVGGELSGTGIEAVEVLPILQALRYHITFDSIDQWVGNHYQNALNIAGSNYFMLRDTWLAQWGLINIGWDAETSTIIITTN